MRFRSLGDTGLRVSELGFGGGPISGDYLGPADDEESLRTLNRAFELGVNFYDTVDRQGHGRSERLIGKAFRGKRDKVIIATKGGRLPGSNRGKIRFDYSRKYIHRAIEASLKRLHTDYVDIYQIHNPPFDIIEREEVFDVFEGLRREGKTRFVGACLGNVIEGLAVVEKARVQSIQVVYNLLDQEAADGLFPAAQKAGIGVIARVPLASGLLTGRFTKESHWDAGDIRRRMYPEEGLKQTLRKMDALESTIRGEAESLLQASLRFVLSNPSVSTVIPGVKTVRELEEDVSAQEKGSLTADCLQLLREAGKRASNG